MKANELRDKTVAELELNLEDLLKQQFKHRMEHGTDQLNQTHRLRQLRRNIARVKTIIGEKHKAGADA